MHFFKQKTGWLLIGLALLAALILVVSRFGFFSKLPAVARQATAQPLEVLYLSPVNAPELWRVGADGKNPVQLTATGGSVYDFAVSPDGKQIAFSAGNAQNGRDLWEIDRAGGKARALIPCGTDWCQTPAYAPDGKQIAYSRRQYNGLGGEPGTPELWMLDRDSRATKMVTGDASMSGSDPAWSPDGRYLAFVDTQSGGVRVLDLQGKKTFVIPAEDGITGAWSPDGQKLLVVRMEGELVEGADAPGLPVSVVDARTQQSSPLPGAHDPSIEYSLPDWSPDGQWLAAAQKPFAGSGGKQLWVFRADGSQQKAISSNPLENDASYHWSPDGKKLVFQRMDLNDPGSSPKIMLWDRTVGAVTEIAKEGFQPHWLP